MSDGPYVFRHGDVWFLGAVAGLPPGSGDNLRRVCGPSEQMAVAYDGDVLLKHGSAEYVTRWAQQARKALADGPSPEMSSGLTVVSFLPVPAAVEELNACIATTGRIAKFETKLMEIGDGLGPLPPAIPN